MGKGAQGLLASVTVGVRELSLRRWHQGDALKERAHHTALGDGTGSREPEAWGRCGPEGLSSRGSLCRWSPTPHPPRASERMGSPRPHGTRVLPERNGRHVEGVELGGRRDFFFFFFAFF